MPLQARCNCGAVSLAFKSEPTISVLCHCTDCKRFTGALSAIYVPFAETDVTVSGLPSMWATTADSGRRMRRYFCGGCGSSLYDKGERRPDLVFVHGGTLPNGSVPPPVRDMYRRNAEVWEKEIEGCAMHGGMPPDAEETSGTAGRS